MRRHRLARRHDGRGSGPVRAACQVPVLGQEADIGVRSQSEGLRETAVQAPPFAWQQMGVKHLPD